MAESVEVKSFLMKMKEWKSWIKTHFEKKLWSWHLVTFSSVQLLSGVWLLRHHELQHARPPCPSPTPRVHPNPCPLIRWCDPAISSSVIPFSSCPQSFPASGSFQMSQLFTSGGQSIGVSASISVLQMYTQDWSPLGWTGCISLQSKGLSRVFSNTTVQKHQISSAQIYKVVSSAYLRLLIFLPALLIPACASSSSVFLMMYSAYKLNKQDDNIQPWYTPFLFASWQIVGETMETVTDFIFLGSRITTVVTAAIK